MALGASHRWDDLRHFLSSLRVREGESLSATCTSKKVPVHLFYSLVSIGAGGIRTSKIDGVMQPDAEVEFQYVLGGE